MFAHPCSPLPAAKRPDAIVIFSRENFRQSREFHSFPR